jgi:hypothetical protein
LFWRAKLDKKAVMWYAKSFLGGWIWAIGWADLFVFYSLPDLISLLGVRISFLSID